MANEEVVYPESVGAFVEQLLNSGGAVVRVFESLIDGLVENGTAQEEAAGEIGAMLLGTVAARFATVPTAEVARAAELIDIAWQAVLTDLERALAIARRRERRERALTRRRRRAHDRR